MAAGAAADRDSLPGLNYYFVIVFELHNVSDIRVSSRLPFWDRTCRLLNFQKILPTTYTPSPCKLF